MPEAAELPTRRDEAWRYSAVERLQGEALDDWRTIDVAAGESVHETLLIADGGDTRPTELHRWRVTVREGATCEIFAVLAAAEYARLEIEVTLHKGAHFELGGITVGGRETVREFVTRTIHAEPEATSNQTVRAVHCYMAARGVSPDLARRLLVQAFLGDALVALEDDETREAMLKVALDKVDRAL